MNAHGHAHEHLPRHASSHVYESVYRHVCTVHSRHAHEHLLGYVRRDTRRGYSSVGLISVARSTVGLINAGLSSVGAEMRAAIHAISFTTVLP